MAPQIEVCVDNLESLITANQLPIDRIELCSALSVGGISPNYGLLKQAVKISKIPLAVMIRPRAGDFVFNSKEVQAMKEEIALCRSMGITNVVIGALTRDAKIDQEITACLVEVAKGIEITFHRAFDLCADPMEALEQLIKLGCHRILTSGQQSTAFKGIPLLKELVSLAQNRIQIMAGCGVNADNVGEILTQAQVPQIHFSAKGKRPSAMQNISEAVMGDSADQDNWLEVLDLNKAQKILQKIGKG